MGEATSMYHHPDDKELEHRFDMFNRTLNPLTMGEALPLSKKLIEKSNTSSHPDGIVMAVLEHVGIIRNQNEILTLLEQNSNSTDRLNQHESDDQNIANIVERRIDVMHKIAQAHDDFQQEFYEGTSLNIDKLELLIDATDKAYGETPLLKTFAALDEQAKSSGLAASNQYIKDADRIARIMLINSEAEAHQAGTQ